MAAVVKGVVRVVVVKVEVRAEVATEVVARVTAATEAEARVTAAAVTEAAVTEAEAVTEAPFLSPCFVRVLLKRTQARFDRIVLVGVRTLPGGAWLSTAAGEWYLFDTSVLFSVLRCARLAWASARTQSGLLATGVPLFGSKADNLRQTAEPTPRSQLLK